MRSTLLLALILLTPAAQAWGSADVESSLRFPQGVRVDGTLDARATAAGVLDLAPALRRGDPVSLAWAGAEGYRIVENSTHAAGVRSVDPAENRSVRMAAATVLLDACLAECVALLVAEDGGGEISVAGPVSSPLSWIPRPRAFHALATVPDIPDTFYHEVPAGAFAIAAQGEDDPEAAQVAGPARATGALALVLYNVTGQVVTGEGVRPLEAEPHEEPLMAGVAGGPSRMTLAFLVLRLEEARYEGAGLLFASSPTLALEGALFAPEAHGRLRADRNVTHLEGERLMVRGSLVLEPAVTRGGVAAPLLERQELRATVRGEATLLLVQGQTVVSGSRDAAAAAGASLALLLLVALRFVPWTPLYSRIDRSRVLDNPNRQRLLQTLRERPGLTPTALAREAGMARAVALHHVAMLEAHRLVIERRTAGERRLFVAEAAPDARTHSVFAVLGEPARRAIARVILETPGMTQAQLSERTALSARLVSYHLSKLEQHELVATSAARPKRYHATMALAMALEEVSGAAVAAAP